MSFVKMASSANIVVLTAATLILIALNFAITSQFYFSIVTISLIYGIAAIGLTLLLGFAGQISLGQGAFFGLGAYVFAYFIQHLGMPIPVAILAAIIIPAAAAYVLARPILRLSGHNLALATLALSAVFFVLASQWSDVTGGLDPGIIELPTMAIGNVPHGQVVYWIVAALFLLSAAVALALSGGKFGRALKTLRSSEVVASCMGINTSKTKTVVFAIAAGYAGLGGALLALFLRSFNASTFDVSLSIEILMMVIVGSLSTIWGAVFGAVAVTLLPNLLENFDNAKQLIYGLVMVGIMMFAPNGLGEALGGAFTKWKKRT